MNVQVGITSSGKERQSNIELLRIIAMAMILILHADALSLSIPTIEDFRVSPLGFSVRHLFESLCIGSVDVFILISGYFGIRPSIKSFSKFISQCLFFFVSIYIIAILTGISNLTITGVREVFFLTPINWFITAYIGLYLLAPILNVFIDNADRKQHRNVIIAFYVFQTIYGCTGAAQFFVDGYGTLSFIGLYLLARYIKIYPPLLIEKPRAVYLLVYLISCLALFALQFVPIIFGRSIPYISDYNYINPIVLLMSVSLLIYFTKIDFQSKVVNWIAASSFAVFLLHSNPNIISGFFKQTCIHIYQNYNGIVCFLLFAVFLLSIYAVAFLCDQIRILIWHQIEKKFVNITRGNRE